MTVVDDELAARRGEEAATGVVTDDAADDTPYSEMSDDDRSAAYDELVRSGVPEDAARKTVWGETEPEPEPEPKPPKLLQEPLPGDWDSISEAFGGATPDTAEIRLLGGKMPIEGSFAKGTEIDLLVRVRVTGVLGQDLEDAYGTRGHTVRRHMARMISVRRATRG